jgi:hypothetical protein
MRTEFFTSGTNTSTKVEKKISYVFADGVEISSQITSKTTFDKQRRRRHGPSYNLNAMAALVEAAASAGAETAAEENEHEMGLRDTSVDSE